MSLLGSSERGPAVVVDALSDELSELRIRPEQLQFTADAPIDRDRARCAILHSSSKPRLLHGTRSGDTDRRITVGVKRLKYLDPFGLQRRDRIAIQAVHLLSKARHPNILPFRGFHIDFEESVVWLISDWEPLGNILDYIRNHDVNVIERLKFLHDIAKALAYLHSLGPLIYHGDIKATNVLVSFDRRAMLGDFGQARVVGDERFKHSVDFLESIPWCSPEALDGKPLSPESDIWSFGCLVWEIATGKAPFSDLSTKAEIIWAVTHRWLPQLQHESFFRLVPGLSRFVMDCWHNDAAVRPSAQENSTILRGILVDTKANWVDAPGKGSWLSWVLAPVTRRRARKRAEQRTMSIDTQIEADSRRIRKECKILLLGSAESGKSTLIKQMKIIHQNGYTPDELAVSRLVVYKNLVDSAKDIVRAMVELGVECVEGINRTHAKEILAYEVKSDSDFRLSAAIISAIDSLWKDPIIATVMDHSSEFYFMESASYFFREVRRIGGKDYIPNESDVLRAVATTAGVSETRFNMGQLSIHIFDVGDQRTERKKWIHCFEAVTSVIFCVALSDYDQVLFEGKEQTAMADSLVLFESVINSRCFLRTSMILFLNKIDVFQAKLPKVPLERYFPDYTGGPDINKAAKYILWRFTQANRARLSVYPHLTEATDPSNIRLVFAAVKETVLQNALRDSGIL